MIDVFLLEELRAAEQGSGLVLRPGGSAANTAAWLASEGHEVAFTGCVGQDTWGAALEEEIGRRGVRVRIRAVAGAQTGAVAVQVGSDGERVMRSSRGANAHLVPEDLERLQRVARPLLHLTGYSLLGPNAAALLHGAGELARHSILSFDPSSVSVIASLGRDALVEGLRSAEIGLLLPNAEEAMLLAGCASAEEALEVLGTWCPRVAISLGEQGAIWADGTDRGEAPTRVDQPVDTTGAGDAFNAGVIAALVAGEGLGAGCALGNILAGRAISRLGGMPG